MHRAINERINYYPKYGIRVSAEFRLLLWVQTLLYHLSTTLDFTFLFPGGLQAEQPLPESDESSRIGPELDQARGSDAHVLPSPSSDGQQQKNCFERGLVARLVRHQYSVRCIGDRCRDSCQGTRKLRTDSALGALQTSCFDDKRSSECYRSNVNLSRTCFSSEFGVTVDISVVDGKDFRLFFEDRRS